MTKSVDRISNKDIMQIAYGELENRGYDISKIRHGVLDSEGLPRISLIETDDGVEAYMTIKLHSFHDIAEFLVPEGEEVKEMIGADQNLGVDREAENYTLNASITDKENIQEYLDSFEEMDYKLSIFEETADKSKNYFIDNSDVI